MLQFLADEKYVSLEHYFVDGTKIGAMLTATPLFGAKRSANTKAKLQENVHALFADIEAAEQQEEQECRGKTLPNSANVAR